MGAVVLMETTAAGCVDLAERTRQLLERGDLSWLATACQARRDGTATDAAATLRLLTGAEVEDLAVKRNLVFLQWRTATAKGAAVLAWDQDGKVTAMDVYD